MKGSRDKLEKETDVAGKSNKKEGKYRLIFSCADFELFFFLDLVQK